MPDIYPYILPILVLAATCAALWQWRRVRDVEADKKQLKKLCVTATENLATASRQMEEATNLAKEQWTRANGYFVVIEQIGVERDRWNGAYHDASGGHRTAQAMLMNELNRLSKILMRAAQSCTDTTGKKGRQSLTAEQIEALRNLCSNHVDPKIAVVVAEYSERHGEEGMTSDIEHAPSKAPEKPALPVMEAPQRPH